MYSGRVLRTDYFSKNKHLVRPAAPAPRPSDGLFSDYQEFGPSSRTRTAAERRTFFKYQEFGPSSRARTAAERRTFFQLLGIQSVWGIKDCIFWDRITALSQKWLDMLDYV